MKLNTNQKLTETWTVKYERRHLTGPHEARADIIVNGTSVACSGTGDDTEAALIDVLLRIVANQILCAGKAISEGEREIHTVSDKALSSAINLLRTEQRRRKKETE